jgi:hypothetical protein
LINSRLIAAIFSSMVLGWAFTIHLEQAEAAIIGGETPDTLSLTFSPSDSYPSGNSPYLNGPLTTLFSGQYWKVSAQSLAAPTGPAAGQSTLFIQQVIPGQNPVSSAVFGLSLRNTTAYTQQISYLANAPAQIFNQPTCAVGSSNCVFYKLRKVQDLSVPNPFISFNYQLQGSFQTALPPVPLTEKSTVVGVFDALSLMAVLRIKKRYSTKSLAENRSA